jgi:hypothetical protein
MMTSSSDKAEPNAGSVSFQTSTVPDGCDGEPKVLHSENSERVRIDYSTMADEEADVAAMLDLSNNKKKKKKDKKKQNHNNIALTR